MGVRVIGGEPEHAEIEAERAGGCQHIPRKVSTLGLVKARMAEAEKAKEEAASSIGEEKATNPSNVPASRRSVKMDGAEPVVV